MDEHIRIMIAIKEQLINSVTPFKAPEVVKAIRSTCKAIDQYIENPSEELFNNVSAMIAEVLE